MINTNLGSVFLHLCELLLCGLIGLSPVVAQDRSTPSVGSLSSSNEGQAPSSTGTVMESSDGEVTLRLTVSPNEVRVAETFQVTLEVDAPQPAKVSFEDPDWNAYGFYLGGVSVERSYPILGGSELYRWVRTIPLESYRAGEQLMPPIQVLIEQLSEVQPKRLQSGTGKIFVVGMLGEEPAFSDFRDIRDLPLQESSGAGTAWLGWGSLIAIMALVAVALVRRRQRTLSPDARALIRLTLWNTNTQAQGDVREAMEELAEILRDYLGELLQIEVVSQSTSEITTALVERNAPLAVINDVRQFLERADQIRFSGGFEGVDGSESRGGDDLVQDSKSIQQCIHLLSQWHVTLIRGEVE